MGRVFVESLIVVGGNLGPLYIALLTGNGSYNPHNPGCVLMIFDGSDLTCAFKGFNGTGWFNDPMIINYDPHTSSEPPSPQHLLLLRYDSLLGRDS